MHVLPWYSPFPSLTYPMQLESPPICTSYKSHHFDFTNEQPLAIHQPMDVTSAHQLASVVNTANLGTLNHARLCGTDEHSNNVTLLKVSWPHTVITLAC
jgi:hypothetical protein